MTVLQVTWRQVTRWRAGRQLLTRGEPDPAEVARRLTGIHAQVASSSVAIAAARGSADGVDDALWTGRTLVRTWAMRGTLHLLPADELGLWAAALTDRESRRRFPPWEREHGVSGELLHAITTSIGRVLDATPVRRAELVERVCADLGRPEVAEPMATSRGALLKPAAARGLLCSGPDGTFVSPADWLGHPLDGCAAAEANQAVLLRFLAANGPATAADVARWWGEQPAPARRWIKAAPVAPVGSATAGGRSRRAGSPRSAGRQGGSRRCWSSTGGWPGCGSAPPTARSPCAPSAGSRRRCAGPWRSAPTPSSSGRDAQVRWGVSAYCPSGAGRRSRVRVRRCRSTPPSSPPCTAPRWPAS
jgi:hypothetical protein